MTDTRDAAHFDYGVAIEQSSYNLVAGFVDSITLVNVSFDRGVGAMWEFPRNEAKAFMVIGGTYCRRYERSGMPVDSGKR